MKESALIGRRVTIVFCLLGSLSGGSNWSDIRRNKDRLKLAKLALKHEEKGGRRKENDS